MAGTKLGREKQAAAACGLSLDEWRARRAAGLAYCGACKEWAPADGFPLDKTHTNGRASICKPCYNRRGTLTRYNLTPEQMAALSGADGTCPICERPGLKLEVDHNHETGLARGLLCSRCNGGLGLFEDSLTLLEKAAKYLERHDG